MTKFALAKANVKQTILGDMLWIASEILKKGKIFTFDKVSSNTASLLITPLMAAKYLQILRIIYCLWNLGQALASII